MKSQQVNKVDLSLDDIIKMDGLGQPQDQNRGQGNQRNKGPGQKGFRPSGGQQGSGGQGGSGISPLNRDKVQGSGMNTANRGQSMSRGGQQGNGRPWVNRRGGQWGGPGRGNNNNMKRPNNQQFNNNNNMRRPTNNMRRPTNKQQFNTTTIMMRPSINQPFSSPRPAQQTVQGNGPVFYRGDPFQGSVQRGILDTPGGSSQGQGGSPGGLISSHRQSTLDQGQGYHKRGGGGGILGQGNLRIRILQQAGSQVEAQTPRQQQGLKQMCFEEKRQTAMQALREARKTIAQLDQQAARHSLVNARRGIAPQSAPALSSPSLPFQRRVDDRYGSSLSLASDSSQSSSSSSECPLEGRQIASFNLTTSSASMRGHKRWQHKSLDGDDPENTLTISFDNSASFVSHADLQSPLPPVNQHQGVPLLPLPSSQSNIPPLPYQHPHHLPQQQAAESWRVPQAHRVRKQPYSHPRQQQQLQQQQLNGPRHTQTHQGRQHYQQTALPSPGMGQRDVQQHPLHWQPPPLPGVPDQTTTGHRTLDGVDTRRGATPSFSRQLSQLKPTLNMKYQFQKRTFCAASTPVSLNDRFSDPTAEERKVFM